MKPVIALVGRPNVGKSTLFNQLTKSRDALVADLPGLTRDRKYGDACVEGKSFIVIDTGGIGESEQGIDAPMAEQSRLAIEEAEPGVKAIAVVVRAQHDQRVLGTMSIAGPLVRMGPERDAEFHALLRQAALEGAQRLQQLLAAAARRFGDLAAQLALQPFVAGCHGSQQLLAAQGLLGAFIGDGGFAQQQPQQQHQVDGAQGVKPHMVRSKKHPAIVCAF